MGRELDPDDTVRVVSNLVPIPASVVDPKGFAIVGLTLEDFELRVDGQVRSDQRPDALGNQRADGDAF